ncbi:uracil-DNA glycosylase family protein [Altererythrobacter aurantiacus]|uniref:Uracil-DNA glycosylase family protein n=1 Tax=Parapontixanthobacter aurantiacus TaxID=1463599 RepID=A0A844ZAV2_9SPHN|nr:uracil-DNA glycosylase family protein [Parapontixanthobacter aurantiacus]
MPLGPKPIVQFSATSRVVVIGQAPGRITHETGLAFDDKSGHRLAGWLGVSFDTLHDPARFAIVSMGFCYPGKASGGDKPPRPECAPTWHDRVWRELPEDRLTLLVGAYAQRAYLTETKALTMTARIERYREFLPRFIPLPHPAWRSALWMAKHPWFEADVLPELRRLVAERIGTA